MSIFDGMTNAQLQAALVAAQQALIDLQTGNAIANLSYTQGDGSKSVTKRVTTVAEATQLILQLQRKLGIGCGRRPIRFVLR